jgi:hypothetical protein
MDRGTVAPERVARAREWFARAAEHEFGPAAPLYARLAPRIAADPDLPVLIAQARPGQPLPVFFLGAVHYLLMQRPDHPLAAFYASLTPRPNPHDDPFPAFRAFCLEHWDALRRLLQTRRVQTNEVRRCACLAPVFALVARAGGGRPLALIEVGASAGLNLLWDRYYYDYGANGQVGDPASLVHLHCELRGPRRPPPAATLPPVAWRLGIDLNPVDLRDPDAAAWLRALIWPEHRERAALFQAARTLALADPPPLRAGDALEALPQALAAAPPDATLCVWHSYTLNQFTPDARARFAAILAAHAARRPLYRVAVELLWGDRPQIRLTSLAAGAARETRLADCSPHGHWMEWLAGDTERNPHPP